MNAKIKIGGRSKSINFSYPSEELWNKLRNEQIRIRKEHIKRQLDN